MNQKQIGYFYLYKRCLFGEIHSPDTIPEHDGHYKFWIREAPKFFCTPDIQTVLLAFYGCDRGRITLHDKKYRLLGTMGVIRNKDKILKLFGFTEQDAVIVIPNDSHYRIMTQDKKVLKSYLKCFKVPKGYKYLIGMPPCKITS